MKYTILMGRGIEGTGNTRFAIELQNYINAIDGETCEVYANRDKRWGREQAHQNHITLKSYAKDYELITNACLDSDKIIILSVPAKNFPKESKDGFMNIVTTAYNNGKSTTYIQVDHKINSINRNFYADPEYYSFFEYLTHIVTHSMDEDFAKFLKKHDIKTNCGEIITASDKLNIINGLNFENYTKYWVPFEEKTYRTIKFLGRVAAWKGPWLFRDMHEKYFKDLGFISTLEGIEMSIQSLQFLYTSWDPVKIVRPDTTLYTTMDYVKKMDNNEVEFERNHNCYMLPPYNNDQAMQRMAKSQFGIELLSLPDRYLYGNVEYAMMEIVAVGTIPIFRKRWGELYKINGKPIIEYGKETGTVFLDENDPQEAVDLICKLSDDKDLYEEYRQAAFKFYKANLDTKVIFKQLLELI